MKALRDLVTPSKVVLLLCSFSLGLVAGCGSNAASDPSPTLTIFAAASLQDLVADLVKALEHQRSVDGQETMDVVLSFAGSNVLAQQILAAPGADLFLSADTRWVDALEKGDRVEPGTRRDMFSNRLAVVARSESPWPLDDLDLLAAAPFRHLALADPEAVPAGRYARDALQHSGHWAAVEARVVPTLDVRAALALVESDPEIVGIVYKTDALASDRVVIHHEVEPTPGSTITYCAAAVRESANLEQARQFLDLLDSDEGRAIIARHGFTPLPSSKASSKASSME